MRNHQHVALMIASCLMTAACQVQQETPKDLPKLQLEQDREMHEIRKRELDLSYERMLKELDADQTAKGASEKAKEAAVTSLRNEWTAKKQELDQEFNSAHPAD